MAAAAPVLALDQGTTSSRAMLFADDLSLLGAGQRELTQHYPAPGWVEHDPEDIWRTTVETAREALAAAGLEAGADPLQEVVLVPAFVGLGAPYWQPQARGALFGLTRATGAEEIARAALEAVCYQTRDLVEAMASDWPEPAQFVLRVDGGMAASDWTMQFLADILNAPVERPSIAETTALGAAWLAGYTAGVWPDSDGFAKLWRRERTFAPTMPADARERRYARWQRAVRAVLAHAADG